MSHTSLCSSGIQPSCPNWEGQTSPCEEINRGPLDMILANSVAEVPADNQHQHPDRYLQMIPFPSCWVNPPFLECHIPGLLWFLAFSDWFLSVSHMLWRCLYVLLWFNLSLSFFFLSLKPFYWGRISILVRSGVVQQSFHIRRIQFKVLNGFLNHEQCWTLCLHNTLLSPPPCTNGCY